MEYLYLKPNKKLNFMQIASSGIIIQNKKILLIKRSGTSIEFPGFWACPGGRAEGNETPELTVIREIKEEINLDFEIIELIKKGNYKNRELYRYYGNVLGTIKTQKEEVSDWGWFSYEEAMNLLLSFDYKEIIEIMRDKNLL